jgi:hypothetical protein
MIFTGTFTGATPLTGSFDTDSAGFVFVRQ